LGIQGQKDKEILYDALFSTNVLTPGLRERGVKGTQRRLSFSTKLVVFLVFSQEANGKNFPHLNLRVICATYVFVEFSWMGTLFLSPAEHSCEKPENRSLHLVAALM